MQHSRRLGVLLAWLATLSISYAFCPPCSTNLPGKTKPRISGSFALRLKATAENKPSECSPNSQTEFSPSRRGFLVAMGAALLVPSAVMAKDKDYNDCSPWAPGRAWLTGKSCQEKGKDNQPKDTKGTKKDPKFLKSLQGCRAQCQAPSGTSTETSGADCIKACRDEMCTTYEQCTYQIGPKEDYGGFFF